MEGLKKAAIIASLPASILFSLFLGHYPAPPSEVLACLGKAIFHSGFQVPPLAYAVVVLYRLPRVLAAALVGIALSVAGSALQGLLKNPLVSPYILGIDAGAGLGAAIALAFLPVFFPVELMAMGFALLAFFLVFTIAWGWGKGSIVSLVLSGIIINAIFSAAISLVQYLAPNPHRLASITFWLMGDIGQAASWSYIWRMACVILPLSIALMALRWRINVLSLGDEEAKALGANPKVERAIIVTLAALMVASAVSYAGIIGWVGLLVPHIIRLTVGSDNRLVIPYSFFLGGTYLVLADDLARFATSQVLPIGVLTTLMGAPLLIWLLRRAGKVWRRRRSWQRASDIPMREE